MITAMTMANTPIRTVKAKVELYKGSTLAHTFRYNDDLINFELSRMGDEGKFFGFGIVQKLTITLRDLERAYNIVKDDYFLLYIGANEEEIDYNTSQPFFPKFYVEEVKRDENTNELTIVAYDALYKASTIKTADINLELPYEMSTIVGWCAADLDKNITLDFEAVDDLDLLFSETGANIEGTETAQEIFNAAAEATQSIYYIKNLYGVEFLVFKRLDFNGEAALVIDRDNYFELASEPSRTLAAISHATELGDNLIATSGIEGETQYIRDNPFMELREDLPTLLEQAVAEMAGATITPFTCKWRGNYLAEMGDKIELITKDGGSFFSFMINDSLKYDGGLYQTTSWSYTPNEAETANNPTNLGDALKQTFAKVDKVGKQITIVASDTLANREAIGALQINTSSISASVKAVEENTKKALEGFGESLGNLTEQVELSVTKDQVKIEVQKELENGANSIKTGKGFRFDDSGMTVEDISDTTNATIRTTVSNNGMKVFADGAEMLRANDEGVVATDLHAKTFLIIGTNSRFENYGYNRTGCFWIGG